jgi:hypothetical protein
MSYYYNKEVFDILDFNGVIYAKDGDFVYPKNG